jgi:hypothetical protein
VSRLRGYEKVTAADQPWVTKQRAAELLGVTTKTIEVYVASGKLRQIDGRSPKNVKIKLINREDIDTQLREQRGNLMPFLAPGDEVVADVRQPGLDRAESERWYQQGFVAGVASERSSQKLLPAAAPPPATPSAYVKVAEALLVSGISRVQLRLMVREGRVQMLGRRYRRKDLEGL